MVTEGYTVLFPCETHYLILRRRINSWLEIKENYRDSDFTEQETCSIVAEWIGMEYLW